MSRIRRPAPTPAGGGVRRDRARRRECCCPGSRRRSRAAEQWTLPGGGIDFGEDPRDAVVREVHEETGLDCDGRRRRLDRLGAPRRRPRDAIRPTCTPCGSCTTPGSPPTRPSPGSSRSTAPRWTRAGPARGRRAGRGRRRCRWCATRSRHHRPRRLQRVAAYALVLPRRRRCCSPGNSAARPPPGHLDAARRRRRPRGAAGRRAWSARCARRPGSTPTVGRAARRARRALHRHRPARARGGLPRRRTWSSRPPSGRANPARARADGTTDAVAWVPWPTSPRAPSR